MDTQKQKVLDFIRTKMLGVISTVNPETKKPESAVVAFSETDTMELIFGTFNDTRKYKNLQSNKNISFVIGWDDTTIQYEGIAEELSGENANEAKDTHLSKNPGSKKYALDKKQRFFKISPTWIRYTKTEPEEIFEISFND